MSFAQRVALKAVEEITQEALEKASGLP